MSDLRAENERLRKALEEAQAGLEFAVAAEPKRKDCDFVSSPALALRIVNAALTESPEDSHE